MKIDSHYDTIFGAFPFWKQIILKALEGDTRLLDSTSMGIASWSPSAMRGLQAAYAYAKCGQQTYAVGPRMLELLSRTATTAVPADFMRLPFPCIYVAFPDSPWSLWGGPQTKWHPLSGCYVQTTEDGKVWRMLLWAKANERSMGVGDDATFWTDVFLDKCKYINADGVELFNVSRYVQETFDDPSEDASDEGLKLPEGSIQDQQFANVQQVVKVIINLVLYLNSLEPEVTVTEGVAVKQRLRKQLKQARSPKKIKRLRRRLAAMNEARVIWIGKSLENQPKPKGGGKRVVSKHWRAGHFRRCWTGSKRDADGNPRKGEETVLRWIKPTWVGSDMASLVKARGTIRKFREDKDNA